MLRRCVVCDCSYMFVFGVGKERLPPKRFLAVLLMTKVGGHLPRIPYRQFMLLSSSPPSPPSSSSSMLSSSRQHADTQHPCTPAPAHAQAHETHIHTSHTLRDTQAHTHARSLTYAPTTKTLNSQNSCSQREQRPAPFPTRPRRTGCASFRDSFGPSRRARHP